MTDTSILGPTAAIRGICRLTPERAQRGFLLNQFLTGMRQFEQRAAFVENPERCMASYGLSAEVCDIVRRRDFAAMLDYGASNVAIGKAGPALGVTLVERGAKGRGQSVTDFITQRKAANQGQPWQF
jgi:gallate dioxygenase